MPQSAIPEPFTIHNGLSIYRFGQGAPIFFMPGPHRLERPGLRAADAIIAGLVALGRQVITFDPPASGHSTRPAHLSMEEMLACTDETLDVCAVSAPVDALGHSMSGLCLLAYAIAQPRRVSRLVLVGAGSGGQAYMNAPGALWNRSHPRFWPMAFLGVLHFAWPRLAPQTMLLNLIEQESFCDKNLVHRTVVSAADWLKPRQSRTDWSQVAARLDYSGRLKEIASPSLILVGRHDPQYPPSASEELHREIPHSRLYYFAHSGHYPFIEEPDTFWKAVDDFLSGATA